MIRKVGHAGTLDPAASGVLPMGVGRATRLLPYLQQAKAYQATVRFGLMTTTDDLTGDILHQSSTSELALAAITAQLERFKGKIQQIPPRFSAIQVEGQRLYRLARAGQDITPPPREVEVFRVQVLEWRSGDAAELDLAIACGPGTYIRSIARDLGAAVGTGATLAALTRTLSGGFYLEHSLTLEALTEQIRTGTFQAISPNLALQHLPALGLTDELARRWRCGQKILYPEPLPPSPPDRVRLQDSSGQFLGISSLCATDEGWRLVPQMVYAPL
jgi:tRNA pseudouridine55 synthase